VHSPSEFKLNAVVKHLEHQHQTSVVREVLVRVAQLRGQLFKQRQLFASVDEVSHFNVQSADHLLAHTTVGHSGGLQ